MSPPARILVVDDDPAIQRLIARRLTEVGYEIVTAGNGDETLRLVNSQPFDLLLLDIMMPGEDGYSVLRTVRERFSNTALPVIMLSAKDGGLDVVAALRAGANDYAMKPIDWPVLQKRIEVHLALKAGAGNIVGGHRIVSKLGSGSMGVVYAATEMSSGREAAIKVLPRSLTVDDAYVQRFIREADLASRVEHPNVVRVFGAGRDGDTHYIAMELVRGQNVAQLVAQWGAIELSAALGITRQVVAALASLHQAGIVHRDIKPENIIVGDDGRVKLTDFGIAHDTQAQRITLAGQGVGSAVYSSPEQMKGAPDYRSDIYSLGCTFYFMLTGKDPFDGTLTVDQIMRVKQKRPPRIADVSLSLPSQIDELVASMMAPRPQQRFKTHEELELALDGVLTDPSVYRSRRGEGRLALIATLIGLGLVAAVWWLSS